MGLLAAVISKEVTLVLKTSRISRFFHSLYSSESPCVLIPRVINYYVGRTIAFKYRVSFLFQSLSTFVCFAIRNYNSCLVVSVLRNFTPFSRSDINTRLIQPCISQTDTK
jgi:hypothetical protein